MSALDPKAKECGLCRGSKSIEVRNNVPNAVYEFIVVECPCEVGRLRAEVERLRGENERLKSWSRETPLPGMQSRIQELEQRIDALMRENVALKGNDVQAAPYRHLACTIRIQELERRVRMAKVEAFSRAAVHMRTHMPNALGRGFGEAFDDMARKASGEGV